MSVTCRSLLNEIFFRRITLLAGSDGLDRVVSWPCVSRPSQSSIWLRSGQLLFVTDTSREESLLGSLVSACASRHLPGLVLLIGGKNLAAVPQELIAAANETSLPLFSLKGESYLPDIIKAISGIIVREQLSCYRTADFINYLLFSGQHDRSELLRRAFINNVHLPHYCFIGIFASVGASPCPPESVLQQLELYAGKNCMFRITAIYDNTVIILSGADSQQQAAQHLNLLQRFVFSPPSADFDKLLSAFGSIYDDISRLYASYEESRSMLNLLQHMPQQEYSLRSMLGLYRLLLQIQDRRELEHYRDSKLKPLLEAKPFYSSSLLPTLKAFLQAQNSFARTACLLDIHRNSVIYRIKRIRELLDIDFSDSYQCLELMLAILIKEYLEAEGDSRQL